MSNSNNNVGQNEIPAKLRTSGHYDLFSKGGTVDLKANGVVGTTYTKGDIVAFLSGVSTAPVYPDGTPVDKSDILINIEFDLDPVGNEGFANGDVTSPFITTTSDAAIKDNGLWTDIDAGGGREVGKEGVTDDEVQFEEIWVANGSCVIVHWIVRKP